MWTTKHFKTERAAREFIANNSHRYQCELLFVHNGCVVEYKKLRQAY